LDDYNKIELQIEDVEDEMEEAGTGQSLMANICVHGVNFVTN
jgi:hypothetical protein